MANSTFPTAGTPTNAPTNGNGFRFVTVGITEAFHLNKKYETCSCENRNKLTNRRVCTSTATFVRGSDPAAAANTCRDCCAKPHLLLNVGTHTKKRSRQDQVVVWQRFAADNRCCPPSCTISHDLRILSGSISPNLAYIRSTRQGPLPHWTPAPELPASMRRPTNVQRKLHTSHTPPLYSYTIIAIGDLLVNENLEQCADLIIIGHDTCQ